MKKILILILFSIILIPQYSRAQNDKYKLLEPLPCISGVGDCKVAGNPQPEIDINNYILYVYKFSIAIAVFLAIIMIIWGGFLYITSETPFKIADGREKIQNAVLGLAMVLVSYLILLTIDPRLVNIDSNIPQIAPLTPTQEVELKKFFNEKIIVDLKNLSSENQIQVINNNRDLGDLNTSKLDIQNKLQNLKTGDTPERTSLMKELEVINASIIDKKVDNIMIIGENNGLSSYVISSKFIDNMWNNKLTNEESENNLANLKQFTSRSVANTTGDTPRPIDTPNVIQNLYNIQINELLKINTSGNKIQTLEKQRDFYIQTITENLGFTNLINNVPPNQKIRYLKDQIVVYEKSIGDTKLINTSGLSEAQYKQIKQDELNKAKEELAKTKPVNGN